MSSDIWLAGVDSCPKGWVAAFIRPSASTIRIRVVAHFSEILHGPEKPKLIAVDIPIGLPRWLGPRGRGPEQAIRPFLGRRRSSVFSVPSRSAVFAGSGRFADEHEKRLAHRRTSDIARAFSEPQKGVSIQAFMIFPKIREVDAVVRRERTRQIVETHPEFAFCRLNGGVPMKHPKKERGGEEERRSVLRAAGLWADSVTARPPKGARVDDFLDVLVCAVVARRIYKRHAHPFPNPPERDTFGLPMAIWA